jgi:hypothetical protein
MPTMTKEAFIETFSSGHLPRKSIQNLFNSLPNSEITRKVDLNDIVSSNSNNTDVSEEPLNIGRPEFFIEGDILFHPIFKHPYILLRNKKNEGVWLATILTSNEKFENLLLDSKGEPIRVKSRFLKGGGYVSIATFEVSKVTGTYIGTCDSKAQVKTIAGSLIKSISSWGQ